MLLLGGAATVEALTCMDYRLAFLLIPWGTTLYTAAGGLKATSIASYLHTVIILRRSDHDDYDCLYQGL